MKSYLSLFLFIFALPVFLFADNDLVYATEIDDDDVALEGYDVVAYHTEMKALMGKKRFSKEYQDVTYYFGNEKNLKAFKENPAKYLPQYGGYCAYAIGSYGQKVKVDPEVFALVDGKLYLNYNKKIAKRWHKKQARYIGRGDRKWTKLVEKESKKDN